VCVIVDAHAHLFPARWLPAGDGLPMRCRDLSESTVELAGAGTRTVVSARLLDPQAAAADARQAGCDLRAVMAPPFTMLYELDDDDADRWCKALNDAMAAAVATEPTLLGYAAVPLRSGRLAAAELHRAITELGLCGAGILTSAAGRGLDDADLLPFWRAAAELGAPVFIHPHYVSGHAATEHLYLRNLVGNPLETTVAGAQLVLGGVLDAVPDLRVILAHGGGALPHLAGRLDRGVEVRRELAGVVGLPSRQLGRLHYDTVVFDPRVLRHIGELVGFDRLTIGTDYPFDMGMDRPVDFVRRSGLSDAQIETILDSRLWHGTSAVDVRIERDGPQSLAGTQ
jgi:aminocarboxymuconate-semialdehyde decarboxylase